MFYAFANNQIYYKIIKKNESKPIILLHGWGCDSSIFNNFVKFNPEKNFILIDLPPFGKSSKKVENWSIYTYVQMLISLCEKLDIKHCDVLGHSFGGRIAIVFSSIMCSCVDKCILVDSAGIKPRRNLLYYYKIYKYKVYKKLKLNTNKMGSDDFLNVDKNLKKMFIEIVNEDLSDFAKQIKSPTILIWGELDKDTPLYMAHKLNRKIKSSKLKILKDCGHFSFLNAPYEFNKIVNEFLKE